MNKNVRRICAERSRQSHKTPFAVVEQRRKTFRLYILINVRSNVDCIVFFIMVGLVCYISLFIFIDKYFFFHKIISGAGLPLLNLFRFNSWTK